MRAAISILALAAIATVSFAKDIAPKEPPIVPIVGQVIDPARAEFAPKFLVPAGVSSLQQERDWSLMHNLPPVMMWGYFPMPCTPGYGGGFRSNHGFYR